MIVRRLIYRTTSKRFEQRKQYFLDYRNSEKTYEWPILD